MLPACPPARSMLAPSPWLPPRRVHPTSGKLLGMWYNAHRSRDGCWVGGLEVRTREEGCPLPRWATHTPYSRPFSLPSSCPAHLSPQPDAPAELGCPCQLGSTKTELAPHCSAAACLPPLTFLPPLLDFRCRVTPPAGEWRPLLRCTDMAPTRRRAECCATSSLVSECRCLLCELAANWLL